MLPAELGALKYEHFLLATSLTFVDLGSYEMSTLYSDTISVHLRIAATAASMWFGHREPSMTPLPVTPQKLREAGVLE